MLRHRWEDAVDARENFVTDNRNWSGTDEDHQNWSGTDEDNHKWSGPDGSDSDYEPAYEEEPEEETEGSRGRQLLLEKSIRYVLQVGKIATPRVVKMKYKT